MKKILLFTAALLLSLSVGVVRRVEMLATDHKVVVDFGQYGEKTLLAKFAKLQKL